MARESACSISREPACSIMSTAKKQHAKQHLTPAKDLAIEVASEGR